MTETFKHGIAFGVKPLLTVEGETFTQVVTRVIGTIERAETINGVTKFTYLTDTQHVPPPVPGADYLQFSELRDLPHEAQIAMALNWIGLDPSAALAGYVDAVRAKAAL